MSYMEMKVVSDNMQHAIALDQVHLLGENIHDIHLNLIHFLFVQLRHNDYMPKVQRDQGSNLWTMNRMFHAPGMLTLTTDSAVAPFDRNELPHYLRGLG